MVCPGYSKSIVLDRLLLLKDATMNRNSGYIAVCKKRHVNIGWYIRENTMRVNGQEIQPGGRNRNAVMRQYVPRAMEYEVQTIWFEQNNIQPLWFTISNLGNPNATGHWDGARKSGHN